MKPRMLKIVALGVFLTSLSQFVKAAPVGPEELAQLLKFYAPIRSLSVPFQQMKHLSEMGIDLRSEGRLTVHRPDEIIWEILKPSHLTVVIDKTAVRLSEGDGPP